MVIGCVLPSLVSIRAQECELELDEDLISDDPIAIRMEGSLIGAEFNLRQSFVPRDLQIPNTTFWLGIGNDMRWRIFRSATEFDPIATAEECEAW